MRRTARSIWNDLMPRSPVFSTSEVADAAGLALANASRDLRRMEGDGMVTRIRRGLWAITTHPDFSPYAVVPHLFENPKEGYVSLLSALNLHSMIDQIPRVVQVVTTTQRPCLKTPVGVYEFHQIQRQLFDGFGPYRRTSHFDIATPEKAFFDAMYLSARKGRRFTHLPEVEFPQGFSFPDLRGWVEKIEHEPVRTALLRRWEELVSRQPSSVG